MGYGYGAAIGAKVAFPDRRVIHITGDGSFHMNIDVYKRQLPLCSARAALRRVRQKIHTAQAAFCL